MKRVDMSATDMLREDHTKVRKLFSQYKEEMKPSEKENLVQMICMELHIHTVLEEETFYPAVRKALHNDGMMDEALHEHSEVKLTIDQLQRLFADEDKDEFRSEVQELEKTVEHHVRKEENEMFPKVEKSGLDLVELGQELADRKSELMGPAHPEAAEYEGEEKKKVLAGVGSRSRMQPEKEEEYTSKASSTARGKNGSKGCKRA